MNRAIQMTIIILGIVALVYGISKMAAETTTMIFPVWLIVGTVALVVCGASIGVGLFIKHLLSSVWNQLTFASIMMITVVAIYATLEYKPTLNIFILPDFSGKVRLFVSRDNLEKRDILVNSFGVGYITRKDFENGFYPRILKGQSNISTKVKEYSKGSLLNDLSKIYSFKYLSFLVPGQLNHVTTEKDELLKTGAVDTTKLPRVSVP